MCAQCDNMPSDYKDEMKPVSPYKPEVNEKMDPDIKEQWLTLLRSGNIKQGKGKLRMVLPSLFKKGNKSESAQRYCCLGVLCDMYVEKNQTHENARAQWNMDSDGEFRFHDERGRTSFSMPTYDVYNWAKMESDVIYLDESDAKMLARKGIKHDSGDPKTFVGLAELNDAGIKFVTIANLIEKYL